jgi:mRNA interferase MazF
VGALATGSVILVRFPFSDLSQSKLRPAVILADCGRGDWLLCQITSNPYSDPRAIRLMDVDFQTGSLRAISFARPAKLFTAHQSLIAPADVGILRESSFNQITDAIIRLLKPKSP